uniref:CCHC-type domain-containing protein n=1 Tax=Timema bartmani TaxID=61472 RepID=A0A7R9F1N6_9NEOP|nr:unnamed protein product [Timema bartmani]
MVVLTTCYKIPASATAPVNVNDNPKLINVVRPYQQNNKKFKKMFQSSQGPKPQHSSRLNYQPSQSALCAGCGGPHARSNCPFKNAQCHNCHFRGHIAKVCRRVKNSSQHQGGVRQIQEDIPSASVQATTSCDLYVVNSSQTPARNSVQLEVNGVPLTMEVETAASASLMGDIKGVEINVVLKEEAIPVFYGPHVIPIPLRDAAKKALGEMESSGFIHITNAHTWETPLVIVSRANKSAWVCRDFSVTVNPHLNLKHYPLPVNDDVYCSRFIVPSTLRPGVLDLLHELHPGSSYMKNLARGFVWWSGLEDELEARTLLITVDIHSEWPKVPIMHECTLAEHPCEALRLKFAAWGLPEEVVSDNVLERVDPYVSAVKKPRFCHCVDEKM